jgi:ubiquinone/menaquinone biosynthesis C-methylase UbiE
MIGPPSNLSTCGVKAITLEGFLRIALIRRRWIGYMPGRVHDSLYSGDYVEAHTLAAERAIATVNLPPGSRILDVGCGSATRTLAMARMGYRCIGLDISQSMLELARQRQALNTVAFNLARGDQLALPFCASAFDGTTCMDYAFGYFGPSGDREVLGEIARVLRSGGVLFCEYLNPDYVKCNWGDWAGEAFGTYCRESDSFHNGKQTLYDSDEWKSMLEAAGYTEARIQGSRDMADTPHSLGRDDQYILITARTPHP